MRVVIQLKKDLFALIKFDLNQKFNLGLLVAKFGCENLSAVNMMLYLCASVVDDHGQIIKKQNKRNKFIRDIIFLTPQHKYPLRRVKCKCD